MPASLAYPMIYHRLTGPLTEDGHLEVDALLGFADAVERSAEAELELIRMAGGGIA